jgi:hypothetical protein
VVALDSVVVVVDVSSEELVKEIVTIPIAMM